MAEGEFADPGDHAVQRLVGQRYRLGRMLGRGSMGTVWAAYDELLCREVAVKEVLLPPGMPEGAAAEQRERAMREARAIARLSHPNVVTVHDVVRQGGEPFVVMELVASISLANLIVDCGALDEPLVAAVADGVAAALQAAHRRGITHRDVKPGNVLLGEDGLVKLTDFGLARSVSELTLTRAGLMLGTPAYIAPELARGLPTTSAADLWELGATLYAAVRGRPPYDVNNDPLDTVHEVVHGEVPDPEGTGPLHTVIAGLMVKDPAARMPLAEVRALVRPMLPAPDRQLWSATDGTASRLSEPAHGGPTSGSEAPVFDLGSPELASDPGPLPFAASAAKSRRRSGRRTLWAATAALGAGALTVGGVLGFRPSGEKPASLPAAPVSSSPVATAPPVSLVDHAGTMKITGVTDAAFTIKVPETWTENRDPDAGAEGPAPVGIVNYVSPDARTMIEVRRISGYFDTQSSTADYVRGQLLLPIVAKEGSEVTTVVSTSPAVVDAFYFDRNLSSDPYYCTKLHVLPHGLDLWVVAVTIRVSHRAELADLFDQVAYTFEPGD
ncbi:serine/threonine-protein kinase [Amycolatopsis sp. PS_44_ISF1]|uniref:serine/threonine-protein kinase n=1 Tax=Amycolatopsis sp. PS_44_ISF1 TaxID=2974917 RepID=UPI0028DEFBD4|nr:serine/threonine-protein kinase [Amycolatopsis sp. PS_44_ISF1]MDT8912057.1 serine/threonine protein kinase [Amycolatopsis sp. PS_44_ISF1]